VATNLTNIITELETQAAAIDRALAALREIRGTRGGTAAQSRSAAEGSPDSYTCDRAAETGVTTRGPQTHHCGAQKALGGKKGRRQACENARRREGHNEKAWRVDRGRPQATVGSHEGALGVQEPVVLQK
jgi:hypothetical protein